MEWVEQQSLGELGLAGIFVEIPRVLLAILPGFDSACYAFPLLAHVAVCGTFFPRLVSGGVSTLVRLLFSRAFFLLLPDFVCVAIFDSLFVLSVDTLYVTKGAVRAAAMNLVTDHMFTRHNSTVFMAVALLGGCVAVSGDAWRALRLLHAPAEIVVALQLLGGAWALAGTAYIALVCHLACVVLILEDASGLAAMRRSLALLADGNFWRVAAVFAVLDGSFVAALMNLPVLVLDEPLPVSVFLQLVLCLFLCAAVVVVTVRSLRSIQPN
jgi:hypothetical protein